MELKDKTVLVVGLGTTGESVCRFLLNRGARVKVSESRSYSELGAMAEEWARRGVQIETGGHNLASFLDADLIVTSPGIPELPVFKAASQRGKKIISEIELAYWYIRGRIVGITGSNGKSTVASLTFHILKNAGFNALLAGNIGTPLISLAESGGKDTVYVTELSSFQLSRIDSFSVSVAVMLNFSPDHIDWHKNFANYIDAKLNLLRALDPGGSAVLNRDDPRVWRERGEAEAKIYGFSREHGPLPGCWLEKEWIYLDTGTPERCLPVAEIPLPGIHNQENVMASALTARLLGVSLPSIRKGIKDFQGLEHRLEQVRMLDDIEFYNDSKATNVDASLKSIQSFKRPIIIIMGGRDKGSDFSRLKPEITNRARHIILLGESQEKIRRALNDEVSAETAADMEEAVKKSFQAAHPGDIILLAPACTSFDMFDDFEHRGRVFKQEVRKLKSKKGEN